MSYQLSAIGCRLVATLWTVERVLTRIIGAPDYERYVEHMRVRHPLDEPLSAREFADRRLTDRYSRPGCRCC